MDEERGGGREGGRESFHNREGESLSMMSMTTLHKKPLSLYAILDGDCSPQKTYPSTLKEEKKEKEKHIHTQIFSVD